MTVYAAFVLLPSMALSEWRPMRMSPQYGWFRIQREEAKQALGESYRSGCPNAAFLALLPGLKGGRIRLVIMSHPLAKPFGYQLYWTVARYQYSIVGKVPLVGAFENSRTPSPEKCLTSSYCYTRNMNRGSKFRELRISDFEP
jgi:hypothetical protein